jgi:hypothetical protein
MRIAKYWQCRWWSKLIVNAGSCVAIYPENYSASVLGVIEQLQAINFSEEQLTIIAQDTAEFKRSSVNQPGIFARYRLKTRQDNFWLKLGNLLKKEIHMQPPDNGDVRIVGALASESFSSQSEKIVVDDDSKLRKLLSQVGIPENSFDFFKSFLKNGKLVLIAVGDYNEIESAAKLIEQSQITDMSIHLVSKS